MPASSLAATWNWKLVPEARPETVALVDVTVAPWVLPWKITYEMWQLAPAVDAFHPRFTLLVVWLGELRPPGTLGTDVHVPPPPPPSQTPSLTHQLSLLGS